MEQELIKAKFKKNTYTKILLIVGIVLILLGYIMSFKPYYTDGYTTYSYRNPTVHAYIEEYTHIGFILYCLILPFVYSHFLWFLFIPVF